jgi:hypothetical protein
MKARYPCFRFFVGKDATCKKRCAIFIIKIILLTSTQEPALNDSHSFLQYLILACLVQITVETLRVLQSVAVAYLSHRHLELKIAVLPRILREAFSSSGLIALLAIEYCATITRSLDSNEMCQLLVNQQHQNPTL